MKQYLERARRLQQKLSALKTRMEVALGSARSLNWPHSSLPNSAKMFVNEMSQPVNKLVIQAAEKAAILPQLLQEPLSDEHHLYLEGQFQHIAAHYGKSKEEVAEASFAAGEALAAVAETLVARVEAVIEGEQRITGETIAHGPLWHK